MQSGERECGGQRLRIEPGLDDPDLLMDVERNIAENDESRTAREVRRQADRAQHVADQKLRT